MNKTVSKVLKIGGIVLLVGLLALGTRFANAADPVDVMLGISAGVNHTRGTVMKAGIQYDRAWFVEHQALSSRSMTGGGVFAAGRQHYFRDGTWFSPFLGLGAAYVHNAPQELLGCSWMWHLKAGAELFSIIQLEYAHNSSADRCFPNKGLDYAGLSFRWRF